MCKWGLEFEVVAEGWQDGIWTAWPRRHPQESLKGRASLSSDYWSAEPPGKDLDKMIIGWARDNGGCQKGGQLFPE